MRSEHDQFISFVGPANLADDVERVEILIMELVLNVHLDADRHILLHHPPNPAIVFDGHHDLRRYWRICRVAAAATLDEDRAPAALARFDRRNHPLIEEELQAPLIEIRRIASIAASLSAAPARAARRLNRLSRHCR